MPADGARSRTQTRAGGTISSGKHRRSASNSSPVSNLGKRSRPERSDALSAATVHEGQSPPSRRQIPAKKPAITKERSNSAESDDETQPSQSLEHEDGDDDDDDEESKSEGNEDEGGDKSREESDEATSAGASRLSMFSASPSVHIAPA